MDDGDEDVRSVTDMDIITNPALPVFQHWQQAIKQVVGENYSMDQSTQIAKTPFARIFMMGNYTRQADLEGNEIATSLSFQVESYGGGKKALTDAYKIDETSHQAMVEMGFTRTYGPELITNNNDPLTRRVISRYQRIYTGFFNV